MKKLLKIALLTMVAAMLLSVAVGAAYYDCLTTYDSAAQNYKAQVGDVISVNCRLSDTYFKSVTWQSDNTSVISISNTAAKNPTFNCLKAGTANISYSLSQTDGDVETGSWKIVVSNSPSVPSGQKITGPTELKVGETGTYKAENLGNFLSIGWKILDADVASARTASYDSRDVTGLKEGTTTLQCQLWYLDKNSKTPDVTLDYPITIKPSGSGSGTGTGTGTGSGSSSGFQIEKQSYNIYSGGNNNTVTLKTIGAPDGKEILWNSSDISVATVTGGRVTGVGSGGRATITAYYFGSNGMVTATAEVVVDAYCLTSVDVVNNRGYVNRQIINQSDFTLLGHYSDGSTTPITVFSIDTTIATSPKTEVRITIPNYNGPVNPNPYILTVTDISTEALVKSIEISSPSASASYKVGDRLYARDVEIMVTDIYDNVSYKRADSGDVDFLLTSGSDAYVFSAEDGRAGSKTIEVKYAGLKATRTVAVTSTGSTVPTEKQYLASCNKGSTAKLTYRVGEKLSLTGLTFKVYEDSKDITSTVQSLKITDYTFTDSDKGTNVTVNVSATLVTGDGVSHKITVPITGLTVSESAGDLDFYEITDVELVEDVYPIGHTFTVSDIAGIRIKENRSSTKATLIKGSELPLFTNEFSLQVLDDELDEKPAKYCNLLEEEDVIKNSAGKDIVNLRFYVDEGTRYEGSYDFTVYVGDSGFNFIYDNELIKSYDDLEDALDATLEQDKDVSTRDFDLDEGVSDKKYILIKMGENYKISSRYSYDPEHHLVIDLNGHDLTFYTDTIDFSKNNKYTVLIKNSSKTAGQFIYDDKTGGTIILSQNEELEFEYGEDIPGFYELTIKAGANGTILPKGYTRTVTAMEAAHGSDVTFTITPDKGYVIDTVKLDNKSVVSTAADSPYTVTKEGVATYVLKGVSGDSKLEATFKKEEAKPQSETTTTPAEWQNNFTDINERSSYFNAVKFVCTKDLFNGVSATAFAPENTMTRAMFVTVLGRLAAKTQSIDFTQYKNVTSFTDVDPNNPQNGYAAPYIEWASRIGLVEGYGDGTFGPNNNITHQQMYLLMQRYANFIEHKDTEASDVNLTAYDQNYVATWALNGVKYAQKARIMVSNSQINPTGNALRWELATVLMLFCQNVLEWNA